MHAQDLLQTWRRLAPWPAGKAIFSFLLGKMVPYTGSIGARVEELAEGGCRVSLRDRRRVRNHLNSIHAIALVNLGEVVTGLALHATMPATYRGIVREINIKYLKKARGTLQANCQVELPILEAKQDVVITGLINDAEGVVVAEIAVTWVICHVV